MLGHHRQASLRSASVSDLQTTYVALAEHLHEEGVGERLEIPMTTPAYPDECARTLRQAAGLPPSAERLMLHHRYSPYGNA